MVTRTRTAGIGRHRRIRDHYRVRKVDDVTTAEHTATTARHARSPTMGAAARCRADTPPVAVAACGGHLAARPCRARGVHPGALNLAGVCAGAAGAVALALHTTLAG